jgi:hypothetical protein
LVYEIDNWDYCDGRDRRFFTERVRGFPAGEPQLADTGTTGFLPMKHEDGECYYDIGKDTLYDYDGIDKGKPSPEDISIIQKLSFVHGISSASK